jgi:broad specificity phosphatase PhoE
VPTVLLIRHAQASFGAADYDVLSEIGHRQVDALVARGLPADQVVTGSMRRQRDTARPWMEGAAAGAATVDERWNEYSNEDVLGHHAPGSRRVRMEGQVSSRDFQLLLDVALQSWVDAGGGGGADESWTVFLARARHAFHDLASSLGAGETGVAFTSGGVIAAIASSLIDARFVELQRVSINTGITKIVVGRQGTTLVSFNEHAHLERTPELLTYR